jgi:LPXTG-motif cell wall-anchored protein
MKYFVLIFSMVLCIIAFSADADAQCAMCRAVVESDEKQNFGTGLNNGILYLMGIPYILLMVLGFFIYRKVKADRKNSAQ